MTPAQAIEKEIEREEQDRKKANEKFDQAIKDWRVAVGGKKGELFLSMMDTWGEEINIGLEIEGKRLALAAVTAHPDDPIGAIDAEYTAEHKKLDQLGREAQALRERLFLNHPYSKDPPPRRYTDELRTMDAEFAAELGRLRGKSIARAAVAAALKGG